MTAFFLEFALGFRGPHHPKSGISHHHYAPQKDGLKLTQDTELLHDARFVSQFFPKFFLFPGYLLVQSLGRLFCKKNFSQSFKGRHGRTRGAIGSFENV